MTRAPNIAATEHALDPDALTRLRKFGGARLLNEMVALYLDSAPGRLAAAEAGLASGDMSASEDSLHSLKASSAQLGAMRLARLCEQGEAIAHRGDLRGLPAVLAASREELERVEEWLDSARAAKPT
jgi:HPt (histidine-containing phosphotransfer) domain-containing protein